MPNEQCAPAPRASTVIESLGEGGTLSLEGRGAAEGVGGDLWHSAGYNSLQSEFPACVVTSLGNALDRIESITDVPCLKTDICRL